MSKKLIVVDTFGFFFRSFYALPPLKNKEGFPTGLLTGFANFIYNLYENYDFDYLVFALDSQKENFRKKIYPSYKSNRNEAPQDLKRQIEVAIRWLFKSKLKAISIDNFEADDVIASICSYAKDKDIVVDIISHDKDLYQLIKNEKVYISDPIKKNRIDEDKCLEKYGIIPSSFTNYQALVGDSSDNIPGVKGIGHKTAQKLIFEYKDLDNIYKNLATLPVSDRIKKLLEDDKENAYLSKELVSLKGDLLKNLDLLSLKYEGKNPLLNILDELLSYDLTNIITKVQNTFKKEKQKDFHFKLLRDNDELLKILRSIKDDSIVAIDTETTGLDYEKDKMVGFSFSFKDNEAYYVPIAHSYLGVEKQVDLDFAKKAIDIIFSKKVVAHNFKFDLNVLERFMNKKLNIFADTMILAWLLDPESFLGLDKLSMKYFDYKCVSYKEVLAKKKNFSEVSLNDASKYAGEDALIAYKLYFTLVDRLKANNTEYLLTYARDVEFEFIRTIMIMENNGILLDLNVLLDLQKLIKEEIKKLSTEIHLIAGDFNINSSSQLSYILFDKLGLKGLKKLKNYYSTDEKTLNSLKDKHKIIPLLLEYRELFKLQSTYIDPFIDLSNNSIDGRIRTSFLQTGTATGRLSSRNPNLQNIPVKTYNGKKIRESFIAQRGKKLIGIDYSQIELRLLAHYSKDETLVKAFFNNEDIHYSTALKLFKDNPKEKRHIAKTVNFGILYGMGSTKLSQTLSIGRDEAKDIIDKYFDTFKAVKGFFADIEEEVQRLAYVETLLKRRRYFDFNSASMSESLAYKREAINTIFQGSASDLIKLAMNKIAFIIQEEDLDVKMLLQIHDELIFEASEEVAESIGERFKDIMKNIYKLDIPLECSLNIANNWADLK